jgi:cathepsin L
LEYNKVYTPEQDAVKYLTWKEAVEEIKLHNALYGDQYEQGVGPFTDMTDAEFKAGGYTGLVIPTDALNGSEKAPGRFVPSNNPIPNAVDWRSQGLVTPIKNQGQCGSCYSFAATGALEGAWKKHSGSLVSLSESQIVDCSGRYGNYGCNGGWYMSSWRYIRDIGGNECENTYPYVARKGWCRFNRQNVCATVSSWHDTSPGSEADLTAALAEVGPVAVAIDAAHSSFQRYKRGVYYEYQCSPQNLDHAVLAVGYGSEGGQDYYLVKNSWGTWWGDNGYIKMARNRNNNCGIATKPSYPIV